MNRMKMLLYCLLCAGFLPVTGCVSKQAARRSYLEGVQRGAAAEQARQNQPPSVTVLGDVRQNVIAWSDGLTLAQAITTAQHARRQSPRAIVLRRGDETIRITPEHLFQGGEDPALLPGDVIELIR